MAAATMYVTPAGAGAKDGTTWATAFGEAEFEADLEAGAEAGDIYYVAGGTYTLDSAYDASARDGTAVGPISIIGVASGTSAQPPTVSDWATGDNRPLFACAANTFLVGDYYKICNLRFTITTANGVQMGAGGLVFNCKSQNNSGTANRYAFFGATPSQYISCEAISDLGIGMNCTTAIFCYIHDSATGIDALGNSKYLFNIIDTCTTGISIASDDIVLGFGNTIYNTTTSVSATDSYADVWINNIVDTTTDGFLWTTQTNINFFAYNHTGNSVTDMWDLVEESVAAYKDNWVTSGDPDFTNEAGGNFSLEGTSPCINAGMAMGLGVG